ncbi:P-loop containing nucleoside triphosphate hydrolase protein [Ilyonectria destructans]|nr:P-loop containing nucleoside triphosphate hydrolase protein [Ilyonectria destructans]
MDVTPPQSVEPGSPERRDPCTWRKIKTEDEGVPKDAAPDPSGDLAPTSIKTEDSQNTTTTKATPSKKKSRSVAKTAREFVARLHEQEDAKEEKKRKREAENPSSRKVQKSSTSSSNRKPEASGQTLSGQPVDVNANVANASASAMPAIQATTHKSQFSQILKSIPLDRDTRHTKTQKRDLKQAVKIFGYKKVLAVDGNWLLKGMQTPLKPYQQNATAWMVKRELARTAPYGGLLGDTMGLGKTVVSLNTIVGNPASHEDVEEFSRATLVVVPNQDIAVQWRNEIKKHCAKSRGGSFAVYSKTFDWDADDCMNQWIVITTYSELVTQFIDKDKIRELKEKCTGDSWSFRKEKRAKLGVLFQASWYRVILDEAHAIKCHTSLTAIACWELTAKFRWALSGTPLSNRIEGMPRNSKCNFTGTLRKYKRNYDNADGNFDVLISLIMYRRTMNDDFLGHRMIDLPDSQLHDVWVPLSKEEQAIYDIVDKHYEQNIAKQIQVKQEETGEQKISDEVATKQEDTDEQQNDNAKRSIRFLQRARLQRLRQAVSHPFNLEKLFRQNLHMESILEMKSRLSEQVPTPILQQLREGEGFADGLSKYLIGLRNLETMGPSAIGGCFNMGTLLNLVENELSVRDTGCSFCTKEKELSRPTRSSNVRECHAPGCSALLEAGEAVKTLALIHETANRDRRFTEAGRDSNGVQVKRDENVNSFFIASCDRDAGVSMPPSSKLTATMAVIMTWLEEAPEDRIIVFTEFIMTAKALGRMMGMAGLSFVYYNGAITSGQKAAALRAFQDKDGPKILLASMKCGGQSLNLTVANRVIIVDPWWNKTQEQQAFGRVVRMGQKKTSYLVRILSEGKIDKHLAMLQEKKSEIVDRALQDDGHTPASLTNEQLDELFSPEEQKEKPFKGKKVQAQVRKARKAKS